MNPERAIDVVDVPREIRNSMNDLRGDILDAVIRMLIEHKMVSHPTLVICRFQPFC